MAAVAKIEFVIIDGVIDHVVETLSDGAAPEHVELHNSRDIFDAKQTVENTPIK